MQDRKDVDCIRRIQGCTAQGAWFPFMYITSSSMIYYHIIAFVSLLEGIVEKNLEYVDVGYMIIVFSRRIRLLGMAMLSLALLYNF